MHKETLKDCMINSPRTHKSYGQVLHVYELWAVWELEPWGQRWEEEFISLYILFGL